MMKRFTMYREPEHAKLHECVMPEFLSPPFSFDLRDGTLRLYISGAPTVIIPAGHGVSIMLDEEAP